MKKPDPNHTVIALRMPDRVYNRVCDLATERERSATWVMVRLLSRVFHESPEWIEDTLGHRLVAAGANGADE